MAVGIFETCIASITVWLQIPLPYKQAAILHCAVLELKIRGWETVHQQSTQCVQECKMPETMAHTCIPSGKVGHTGRQRQEDAGGSTEVLQPAGLTYLAKFQANLI